MIHYTEHSLNATLAARDSKKLSTFKKSQCFPKQI